MQVEFDHQIYSRQRRGGVSRLFVEVARQFLLRPDFYVVPSFSFLLSRNDYLAKLPGHTVRHVAQGTPLDHRRICGAVNSVWSMRPRGHPVGLFHLTYYNRNRLRAARGRPIVSTVYDMIPEMHQELSMNRSAHEHKLAVLRASDLILCISETVRDDLDAVIGNLRAEVRAVPLGAHRLDEEAALHNGSRRSDLILYVGARTGYKRFPILMDAVSRLGDSQLEVFCVGGGLFTPSEQAAINNLPSGISFTQRDLSDQELQAAYSLATVFVSTSVAEGFGLPAVEAMGAGCPVVLTDIQIYRETGGPNLARVPAGDAGALSETLLGILSDDGRRATLARRGWERAAEYSWRSTAEKTSAAYHSLA